MVLLFLGLLPSCYSLMCRRDTLRVMTEGRPEVVVVHRWTNLGLLGDITWRSTVVTVVFYPADILFSTYMALMAAIRPDASIRGGPLGTR